MGQHTTFRLAFRTKGAVTAHLSRIAHLPLSTARKTDFDWYDTPAMLWRGPHMARTIAGMSFSDRIPQDDLTDPYWRLDGDLLTFAADLLNPAYRDDDEPECTIAEPSRQTTLIEALSAACGEPDGALVGGWQNDHSLDWNPLVAMDGRIVPAYAGHVSLEGRAPDEVRQAPAIIPIDAITYDAEHGSVDMDITKIL